MRTREASSHQVMIDALELQDLEEQLLHKTFVVRLAIGIVIIMAGMDLALVLLLCMGGAA